MKVVLDTNVVISGLFFAGAPGEILNEWKEGRFDLVVSPAIIEEYVAVGERLEAKHPGISAKPFLDLLLTHATLIAAPQLPRGVSADPEDDKFLACALAGDCGVIVSGDSDLLDLVEFRGIHILNPRGFLERHR